VRRFLYQSTISASPERVWEWHARPGAFERLAPPWDRVRILSRTGSILDGDLTELELRVGPFSVRWLAEHLDCEPGRGFTDRMVRGPFAEWTHRHAFEPAGEGMCRLADDIEYRLKGEPWVDFFVGGAVENRIRRVFEYRHRITTGDLELHDRYFADRPMKFLISGSSGLIGTSLADFLSAAGHDVCRLTRGTSRFPEGVSTAHWAPERGELDPRAVSGQDVVVHLAGAGIADGRWTPGQKRRILESRVKGTDLLARSLAGAPTPPRVLVCASATGFYGDRGDLELDEGSGPGHGFLSDVSRAWEDAARPAIEAGIRVVHLRIGIVLTPAGGALQRMLPPFRAGLGGPMGTGRQYWSWITLDDLLAAVLHVAASEDLSGPVNAVAPRPSRNAEFSRTLGRVLHRPAALRVPAPAIRLLLGEMGDELLLASARVRPTRLVESGFDYRHGELGAALRHVLGRTAEEAE